MFARAIAFALVALPFAGPAAAQMVTIGAPMQSVGHRFYERANVGWSLRGSNWFARFGAPGAVPFGGFQPGAGLSTGFGGRGGLFLDFSQGASSTFTSTTPMLTVTNAVPGYLFVGSTRPFVTGYAPAIGGGGFYNVPSPFVDLGPANTIGGRMLRGELDRAALRTVGGAFVDDGDAAPRDEATRVPARPLVDPVPPGPAALRERKQAEASAAEEKARDYLARGKRALEQRKPQVARVYYQMAQHWATGELQAEIAARLETLTSPSPTVPPAR